MDSDMTQGCIWKQLLNFAVPLMVGLLFQQLYNTVDAVVVGRFVGKEALAAVGSTGSIINTLVGVCAGLSTGASVVISQCYGAHDYEKLQSAVHTTLTFTGIICVAMTAVGVVIVPGMLRIMDTPEDVFEAAQQYLTIYFAGLSGLIVYNMGSGILRAVGDSRRPLYFLCFSAAINIAFDLLFVLVFDLGIAGVGYATILSQFLSAILVVYSLTHTDAPYRVVWRLLRLDVPMLKRVLKIGLPAAMQQGITAFSNVFVQSYINAFGSACMAGWSSYNKLDVYTLIPLQGVALAASTFVGQNYGARKLKRAKRGVTQSIELLCGITAALLAALILFRYPLVGLFSTDQEVVEYGAQFILLMAPFYMLFLFNQIYAGALRGIGRATTPMIIMLSSFVLLRQIYLYIAKQLGGDYLTIAFGYPLGWMTCTLLMFIAYRRCELCKNKEPDPE